MRAGELQVNQPIEVSVEVDGRMRWAKSRVIDIRGRRGAVIAVPSLNGIGVPLRVETDISIVMPDDSAIWTVSGTVVGRELEPIPCLSIELRGKPVRAQRREHVRVPCLVDAELSWADSAGGHYQRCTSVDISGGGLAVRLRGGEVPAGGTSVRVSFELPSPAGGFAFRARVVRVQGSVAAGWLIGVAFGSIPTADRDRIVRYCFEKQRELIAKGVLKRG